MERGYLFQVHMLITHKKYFSTSLIWNEYAKDNNLPRASTYSVVFGSWEGSKRAALGIYEDPVINGPKKELKPNTLPKRNRSCGRKIRE
jgi:hypothetical protein